MVADYLSRESAMVQSEQHTELKEFFDANPNPLRQQKSNDGGVDIHALYMAHWTAQMLNRSNPNFRYLHDADQYAVLAQQIQPTRMQPSGARTGLSPKTNISNIPKWHTQTHAMLMAQQKMPEPYTDSDIDSDIDSVSSMSSEESDLVHEAMDEDVDLEEVEPEAAGIDRKHRYNTRQKSRPAEKARHTKLIVPKSTSMSGHVLRNGDMHRAREFLRKTQKEVNSQLIDAKPWEPTWNANIFLPKYRVPIRSYYGDVIASESKLSNEWLLVKQIDDAICWNIKEFLETGNKAPLDHLPKYVKRYVLSGRFQIDKKSGVLCIEQVIPQKRYVYRGSGSKRPDKRIKNQLQKQLHRVLPASLIGSALEYAHNLHNGSSKMR